MGGRQLVQMVVGSKGGADVAMEGVPHVDWVVPTAAGNAGEKEKRTAYLNAPQRKSETDFIIQMRTDN